MEVLSFDPKKGKKILCGELVGDTFFRWVDPKHFMRVVQGYGIQNDAFQTVLARGAKKIVLKETATEQRWESKTDDWLKFGNIADYGHGKQRFLSLRYMRTHKLPEDIQPTQEQIKMF